MNANTQHDHAVHALPVNGDSHANADLVHLDIDPLLVHQQCVPQTDASGKRISRHEFIQHLASIKLKAPLKEACAAFDIRVAKSANLEKLRGALVRHWYNQPNVQGRPNLVSTAPTRSTDLRANPTSSNPRPPPSRATSVDQADVLVDDDALLQQYDIRDPRFKNWGEYVLGEVDEGGGEEMGDDEVPELDLSNKDDFTTFQTQTRVDAAKQWEDNRREGGRRAQASVVRSWNIFLQHALSEKLIQDVIVDQHSLLLYMKFTASRCRRDCKGNDIEGTRVGASQIKKEFFGALRIRKIQDAQDPTLATTRPATTVFVYDAVKTYMDQALRDAREGLIPADDAPDIIANTFLEQLDDSTLTKIRYGFLGHRELKPALNGYLAWTLMGASGNRGDDLRALRLCELQPYDLKHPDNETIIFTVLALQSDMEHKARSKAMKTTVNPMPTVFMAHRDPKQCPLGALALHLHYEYDVLHVDEKCDVDYKINKSWRSIRLFHGASPKVYYHDTALGNLFIQAYKKAGIKHRLKQHLQRHRMAYHQEKMGVESSQTVRMGWSRNVFLDTYASAFPKEAILAQHDFKSHEIYDPVWTKIKVPEEFLAYVCPQAEEQCAYLEKHLEEKEDILGALRFWKMVIRLRPYMFQSAAALYQDAPNSPIFRLPALRRPEVQRWMKDVYPQQLQLVEDSRYADIELVRMQDLLLRKSLEQIRNEAAGQKARMNDFVLELRRLNDILERRTKPWSPAKAYDINTTTLATVCGPALKVRARQLIFEPSTSDAPAFPSPSHAAQALDDAFSFSNSRLPAEREAEDSGMYYAPDSSLRGFIAPSPSNSQSPRTRTSVDLVLPPLIAFRAPGDDLAPQVPLFGRHSVQWPEVMEKIKQPSLLWNIWKPSKTLDRMTVRELWDCYNVGEAVIDENEVQTGVKPPLRLVEQHFKASWRQDEYARKAWQRIREIPEWIDRLLANGHSLEAALSELETMRKVDGRQQPLGSSALVKLLIEKRKAEVEPTGSTSESTSVNGKKRAKAVAARPKPKRVKFNTL